VTWVNEVAELCGLDYVQLHGTEPPAYCAAMSRPAIKALRVAQIDAVSLAVPLTAARHGAARLLLDSQVPGFWGGSGRRFDWAAARHHAAEALVAGGLSPENVGEALEVLHPWGLDVSSGVERAGTKDPALIREFLENARRWEVTVNGR
jgi:phosphoribosylanthranilate isomerase